MSKGHRNVKQGHLGPAFLSWLEWLEYCESLVTKGKRIGKPKHMAMNDTLFRVPDDAKMASVMNAALPVDAWLATCVRSSVKYKVDADTFAGLVHCHSDKLRSIRETTPIHLPHEWCTIIVEWGDDTYLMCAQETTTSNGKAYPELEVEADEPWICVNMMLHRKSGVELMQDGQKHVEQQLSYVPVELHMQKGKLWSDTVSLTTAIDGLEVTDKGMKALDIFRAFFLIWLEQFQLTSVLRQQQTGAKPLPLSYKPKRARKRHQFPQFEHTVIQLEIDAPEPGQTGRSIFQPHKRLHQVRGFWRTYKKSGKRVWVKPHWRGDEQLGVIRRDVELVTHPSDT